MERFRVGLIGCGVISDIYLKTCQKFDILDVVASNIRLCGIVNNTATTRYQKVFYRFSTPLLEEIKYLRRPALLLDKTALPSLRS